MAKPAELNRIIDLSSPPKSGYGEIGQSTSKVSKKKVTLTALAAIATAGLSVVAVTVFPPLAGLAIFTGLGTVTSSISLILKPRKKGKKAKQKGYNPTPFLSDKGKREFKKTKAKEIARLKFLAEQGIPLSQGSFSTSTSGDSDSEGYTEVPLHVPH